jgi:hypothetical protein
MTKSEKVRAAAVLGVPLVLAALGVVYAPDLDAKMLTTYGFVLGLFEGAVVMSYATRRS